MLASLPASMVTGLVVFSVRSSRGGDPYQVQVFPQTGAVMCPCIGHRNWGHCRHATAVRSWLGAVIPPGALPG